MLSCASLGIHDYELACNWWAGKDSNLGSRWQQIYSLPPLATWVPARNTLHAIQFHDAAREILSAFFIRMAEK